MRGRATASMLALCAAFAAAGGCARSGKTSAVPGAGSFILHAGYARATDSDAAGDAGTVNEGTVGLRSRGFIGRRAALCVGVDVEGGGGDGGATYAAHVYPLGVAVRLGASTHLSLCGGAGLGGTYDAVPFAWRFPVEVALEVDLGRVRPMVWARSAWVVGSDRRQNGSDAAPFGDELTGVAGVRIGKKVRYGSVRAGNGYYVGVSYRELMGARFVGAVIGYGVSGGG